MQLHAIYPERLEQLLYNSGTKQIEIQSNFLCKKCNYSSTVCGIYLASNLLRVYFLFGLQL